MVQVWHAINGPQTDQTMTAMTIFDLSPVNVLRPTNNERLSDVSSTCVVCGLLRQELEGFARKIEDGRSKANLPSLSTRMVDSSFSIFRSPWPNPTLLTSSHNPSPDPHPSYDSWGYVGGALVENGAAGAILSRTHNRAHLG